MKRFEVLVILLLCAVSVFSSCYKDDVDAVIIGEGERLEFDVARSNDFTTRSGGDEASAKSPILGLSLSELSGCKDLGTQLYILEMIEQREMYPTEAVEQVSAEEAEDDGDDEMITRGAPTTTDNFVSVHGSRGFGLFTYAYQPGSWDAEATTSEYIHNLPVRYWSSGDSGSWSVHDPSKWTYYHWPGANYNVRFYAYAPYSASASNYYSDVMPIPASPYRGVPKISVGVSTANQMSKDGLPSHPDIIIAKSGEVKGDYNQTLKLSFRHAMTGIRFVIGEDMIPGTIKNIEFQNVNRTGTLNLETQEWENVGTKVASISLNKAIAIEGSVDEAVLSADDYFMMVPQTLPSDAKIVVTFVTPNNAEYTLVGDIGGKEWPMGTILTYTITPRTVAETYTFTVTTPTVLSADYLGGKKSEYNITSYRVSTSSVGVVTTEPVTWQAEFSTNGTTWTTTRPAFFSSMTLSGAPDASAPTTAKAYSATIAPITPDDPKNPFGANVADRPANTTTTNLFSANGNSTANCYVINKAGTYTFPLIYGNAVKNNSANTKAFKPGGTASTEYFAAFRDYKNVDITSPYIHNSGTVNSVKLVWTDAPNLITGVKLSTASQTMSVAGTAVRYITFTVPKEHLTPGNAVIAVRDSDGTIMWSWHIWVTTWNGGSKTFPASNGKSFNFATQILGYCPARQATWKARNIKVRFKQVGSNKVSATYSFSQTGSSLQYSEGNMPYYQFGRKDPLLMCNYVTNADGTSTSNATEKICYGMTKPAAKTLRVWKTGTGWVNYTYNGYFTITFSPGSSRSSGVAISTSIKNPNRFYARHTTEGEPEGDGAEYDWCDHCGFNRWDATNTKNIAQSGAVGKATSYKTIYDPCPVGYKVPPVGAFYGFTQDGGALAGKKTKMGTNDVTPSFQAKASNSETLNLPITGDRGRYNGAPWWNVSDPRNVQLWTATPTTVSGYETCAFYVSSGNYRFQVLGSGLAKSSGFAVLPVKE